VPFTPVRPSASPDPLHTLLAKNRIGTDDPTILIEGLSGEQALPPEEDVRIEQARASAVILEILGGRIEIRRHPDLSFGGSRYAFSAGCHDRNNLDDRFVVLGDDHFLSGYGLLNQLGKARLCVSDAEPGHGKPSAMHFIMFEDRYHIG
jgi:hypothetical protein